MRTLPVCPTRWAAGAPRKPQGPGCCSRLPWLPSLGCPVGGEAATAHPHYDSNTGRLVGFSYQVRRAPGRAWGRAAST